MLLCGVFTVTVNHLVEKSEYCFIWRNTNNVSRNYLFVLLLAIRYPIGSAIIVMIWNIVFDYKSVVVAGEGMDETTRYSREFSFGWQADSEQTDHVRLSRWRLYDIVWADCLRYRSGQDFRSISQHCLIDSSPKHHSPGGAIIGYVPLGSPICNGIVIHCTFCSLDTGSVVSVQCHVVCYEISATFISYSSYKS